MRISATGVFQSEKKMPQAVKASKGQKKETRLCVFVDYATGSITAK
ncbi:hypothetical protein [Enterococcus sp.]|nr:hypothetical protein [Enterococcus sp.]